MLIFNDLLQLRNKKKKINIADKKKNYLEMSIDALIEKIQPKFIINFYEFQRNSV